MREPWPCSRCCSIIADRQVGRRPIVHRARAFGHPSGTALTIAAEPGADRRVLVHPGRAWRRPRSAAAGGPRPDPRRGDPVDPAQSRALFCCRTFACLARAGACARQRTGHRRAAGTDGAEGSPRARRVREGRQPRRRGGQAPQAPSPRRRGEPRDRRAVAGPRDRDHRRQRARVGADRGRQHRRGQVAMRRYPQRLRGGAAGGAGQGPAPFPAGRRPRPFRRRGRASGQARRRHRDHGRARDRAGDDRCHVPESRSRRRAQRSRALDPDRDSA